MSIITYKDPFTGEIKELSHLTLKLRNLFNGVEGKKLLTELIKDYFYSDAETTEDLWMAEGVRRFIGSIQYYVTLLKHVKIEDNN